MADKVQQTVTDYEGPVGESPHGTAKTISHGENSFNEAGTSTDHPGSHRYGANDFAARLAAAQKLPNG